VALGTSPVVVLDFTLKVTPQEPRRGPQPLALPRDLPRGVQREAPRGPQAVPKISVAGRLDRPGASRPAGR
jgi:hypothetical protein